MSSLKRFPLLLLLFWCSCVMLGSEEDYQRDVHENPADYSEVVQPLISLSDANQLILDGRAALGTYGGVCKEWARAIVQSSYGPTLPATAGNQLEWVSSSVADNKAQWRGSYANGRMAPTTIGAGQTQTLSVYVPNGDPQLVVVYASVGNVTAMITKSGSTTISATTPGSVPTSGAISSNVTYGQGWWTLTVKNNSSSIATNVVAVVLSKSRFQSDWETARRGDLIQMYIGANSSNRASSTPHTTLVQTDFNVNGGSTCSSSDTTGCNWLDSNWSSSLDGIVRAHNISMNTMILMTAYSPDYGFTVYRLN